MAKPFKTGVARIAIESVMRSLEKNAASTPVVKIVCCGMMYSHREKFRSAVSMRFAPAILVDRACIEVSEGGGSYGYGNGWVSKMKSAGRKT